uniref:Major facilitator superfamily (MFS) profile domain-containing protein n=1 Tax=Romanomermis culicivorax TaxID=13658 RepID=A0A915IMT6_ROMCU
MGVSNGLSNLSGVIGPALIEYLTSNYGVYGWRLCFFISNAIQLCSVAIFFLWASSEEQEWSKDDDGTWSLSSSLQICDDKKSDDGGKVSSNVPNGETNFAKYNDVSRRKSIVLT